MYDRQPFDAAWQKISLGYKYYAITKGKVPEREELSLGRSIPTIENNYYQVRLDSETGAIAHLIDKSTGQDLVNSPSDYRLNEYLYVTGGDPGKFIPDSLKDNRILAA